MDIIERLAAELKLPPNQLSNAVQLLDQGNTVPFIARYRKELTGEMDETRLRQLSDRLTYLRTLAARQAEVKRLIAEQGKLTDELAKSIDAAEAMQQVEDLYLPYRPKRRTRATMAREKGLEPLAESLLDNRQTDASALELARMYVDPDKGVHTADEAMAGAQDIIAERVSEHFLIRELARNFYRTYGEVVSEAKDDTATSVYEMYYHYREPLRTIPAHRVLAMNRGEKEDVLKVSLSVNQQQLIDRIIRHFAARSAVPEYLSSAIEDGCQRLLFPAIEREIRSALTGTAEEQAIKVFGDNVKNLLLQAPVKGKTVLAVDPAYRTGCKLAVVGPTGQILATDVAYVTPPQNDFAHGRPLFLRLIADFQVDVICIGNGTGSRECEEFVSALISEHNLAVTYTIVSEAGASVYSASELAVEELPHLDVTLRGAVSIGRRLQDPLAELVKIDPKSIGVGQYQHDVNQKRLAETLQGVVEDAVNSVGVDLNTASPALLRYVAGISSTVAKNIVAYRDVHGRFQSRSQLLQVPRLGPAAFTQCAGFLRIPQAENLLDNTSVHPESYQLASELLQALGVNAADMARGRLKLSEAELAALAEQLRAGLPTLRDIYQALCRPGRDPREDLPGPIFRRDVLQLSDLQEGMVLPGVVRNVVDFGAFVDIGVKQDGLVHISQISDRYIKHPSEVLHVGQAVSARVISVDLIRKRIGLSLK
ncbi:MAG: Tex family protein [Bacillota bacterium]|jgi:uncharacterized protein